MIEKDFVKEGLRRTRIDEYLEKELERAGYGGMEVQITYSFRYHGYCICRKTWYGNW